MSVDGQSDESIRKLLTTTHRIALVGASMKPWRASHGVMRFLLGHGFDVTPVNPMLEGQTLHGRTVVARLDDAAPLEMVDVFRNTSPVSYTHLDVYKRQAMQNPLPVTPHGPYSA